jgi:hypothetical protein
MPTAQRWRSAYGAGVCARRAGPVDRCPTRSGVGGLPAASEPERSLPPPRPIVMIALEPTIHTAGRAPISLGRRSAPILPSQRLGALLAPNAARLSFRQPLADTVSVFRRSMRPWDSVRPEGNRRRGLLWSHGPPEELAAHRLTFGQCLGPPDSILASPAAWRSTRPQRRPTAQPWGKPWHAAPEAREASALATRPIRALAMCTGSGEMDAEARNASTSLTGPIRFLPGLTGSGEMP